MKKAVAVCTLVLLMGAYTPQDREATKLQGTWEVLTMEVMGQKIPPDMIKQLEMKINFKDDKIALRGKNQPEELMTFKIDAGQKPKTIDATDKDQKLEKGIYEVDGDNLKLCIAEPGKDRPKDFVSKPGEGTMLVTAKRVKP